MKWILAAFSEIAGAGGGGFPDNRDVRKQRLRAQFNAQELAVVCEIFSGEQVR